MPRIYFGPVGTDVGYWYIGADGKLHHVPGWDPEGMLQFAAALRIVRDASQLKEKGLMEATIKAPMEFLNKEFGQHIEPGSILIL